MNRLIKANMKIFFGARYEGVLRSIVLSGIVYLALASSGFKVNIAVPVLALATVFGTATAFVVVLQSENTIDNIRGQLMLPEKPQEFHAAFFCSLAAHTLLTKSGLLLFAYLAVSEGPILGIAVFSVSYILSGAVAYAIGFCSEKQVITYSRVTRTRHSFILYLLRYLFGNKTYISNTVMLWAFSCFLAPIIGESGFAAAMPLGFALCCMNTPLGILLSSDKTLCQKVHSLPSQSSTVFIPYAAIVMTANLIGCGLYLASWSLLVGGIPAFMHIVAVCFSVLGAFLTVALELRFPLLNWKVESDLWRHPRKYVVAGTLLVLAASLSFIIG